MDPEESLEASRQLPPSDEEDFLDFLPDRPDDEGPPTVAWSSFGALFGAFQGISWHLEALDAKYYVI